MDGSVKQHGSGDCHDCLNGTLGMSILMMSADTSKSDNLAEGGQVSLEPAGCERGSIVRQERLRHDATITAHELIFTKSNECLMCVEMCLELDVDELRGMINEDASAREQVIVLGFSSGVEKTTFCRTDKMVD
jgi:hypothetical protein